MPTASDYVVLRGGLAVPLASVRLLLDLEERGLRLAREGEDIVIRPSGRLSDDDRTALRRLKRHVLALLDYSPECVT